jgi:hypothetical protein
VVVGEGLSASPILTTTTLGVSLMTRGAQTQMTTTVTTPPHPPPKTGDAPQGEGGRDNDGAGQQRDGSVKQGHGCDERDEHNKRNWSFGSARAAADDMGGCLSCLIAGSGRVMVEGWMEVEGQGGGGQ